MMEVTTPSSSNLEKLRAAAREAANAAYAPYSGFAVGAALLFEDGRIVTGANVENSSYGLSLCAETLAVGKAFADGMRDGLMAVAIFAGKQSTNNPIEQASDPVTPCGRCRQMLNELAQAGPCDPDVICLGASGELTMKLSALLPHAFGPSNLSHNEITGG